MRIAQVSGSSGPGTVTQIHSVDSIAALEAFLAERGKKDRAIAAPDWVLPGITYDGADFVQPVEPEPELSSNITKQDVVDWAERKLQALVSDIPITERTTWPDQIREADIVLAGGTEPTPFIDTQAAVKGETRAELAQKIKVKASLLLQASGVIVAIRRDYLERIEQGLTEPTFIGSLDLALQQAMGG